MRRQAFLQAKDGLRCAFFARPPRHPLLRPCLSLDRILFDPAFLDADADTRRRGAGLGAQQAAEVVSAMLDHSLSPDAMATKQLRWRELGKPRLSGRKAAAREVGAADEARRLLHWPLALSAAIPRIHWHACIAPESPGASRICRWTCLRSRSLAPWTICSAPRSGGCYSTLRLRE